MVIPEHHLEERITTGDPRRVERLDDPVERDVLMLERGGLQDQRSREPKLSEDASVSQR